MSEARIRVGIGGWTYPPWRGSFYPEGLPHRRELEYASWKFGAIEINATFYGRQSPTSWKAWGDTVPEGFRFAVKGSRYCVTRPKLAEAGEGIERFLDQGLIHLGPKLGPILWMLAARRQFDRDDIAAFLDLLPPSLDGRPLRHAIEARHDSFRSEHFSDLCRERNIAIVFGDDDEFPCIDADTGCFRYARLQRMREEISIGYADPDLDRFAQSARRWAESGQDSYVFLINGAKQRAPQAAMALQAKL